MSSGISAHGATLEAIFAPYVSGTTQAAATGIDGGGSDLNTQFAKLSYGSAAAATGISCPAGDLNAVFAAIGTTNYGLPINGVNYSLIGTAAAYTSPSSTTINFALSSSGTVWTTSGSAVLSGTMSPAGSTGATPASAATVQYAYTTLGGSGGTITNGAPSPTAISGNPLFSFVLSRAFSSPSLNQQISVTVTFRNSGGSVISTTTFTMTASATYS